MMMKRPPLASSSGRRRKLRYSSSNGCSCSAASSNVEFDRRFWNSADELVNRRRFRHLQVLSVQGRPFYAFSLARRDANESVKRALEFRALERRRKRRNATVR